MWATVSPFVEAIGLDVALWAAEGIAVVGLIYVGSKVCGLLRRGD